MRIKGFDAEGFPAIGREDRYCNFGITEAIVAGSVLAGAIGTTAATAVVSVGIGAAVGAASSAITGGNPLTGALMGGLSGGVGSLAGAGGAALGLDSTLSAGIGGAASGAIGGAITGQNPLTSALMGGGQAAIMSGLSSMGSSSNPESGIQGPGQPATTTNSTPTDPTAARPFDQILADPTGSGGTSLSGIANASSGNAAPTGGSGYGSLSPASQVSADVMAEGTGGASAPSSGGALSRIGNYLFGDNTPAAGSVVTKAQAMGIAQQTGTSAPFTDAAGNPAGTVNASGTVSAGTGNAGATSGTSSGGILSNLGNKVLNNLPQAGLMGLQLYNMSQKPSLPTVGQQQAATQGAQFNSSLPQYEFQSTRNPVPNYYTYGYTPQQPQIVNTLHPVSATMKAGGVVKRMAMGGMSATPHMPRAPRPHLAPTGRRPSGAGIASLGALSKMRATQTSPNAALGTVPTMAHGGMFARDGQVNTGTGGKGQQDNVPAMLSEDEFVVPADVVSHLGDGSSSAGGGALSKFVQNVRASKGSGKGLPAKAKDPAHYMPKRK